MIAVNLSANRSKGARGPDEWKPSNTEYWCEYAYDWIRIKDYWNLTVTQSEWDALVSMIETCPAGFSYADAEEEPILELPAYSNNYNFINDYNIYFNNNDYCSQFTT